MLQTFSCNQTTIEVGHLEESSFQNLLLNDYSTAKKVIIVDENTHDNCLEYLLTAFPTLEEAEVILLPVGEENKVMEVCFQVFEALSEYGITRSDLVITLGGGVVSDMGGFIASVFKRGLDCVHIPTSLLGMVDAAIGDKTGIDLGPYKNQIGTFHPAVRIYVDHRMLATLPESEWVNGFAEIIKHALIADATEWNILASLDKDAVFSEENVQRMIANSVRIKSQIVSADPIEKGLRKVLNFGHTFGHAIEGYYLSIDPIPHGTAVALGMIAESYVSHKRGLITAEELQCIIQFLCTYFPCPDDLLAGISGMYNIMKNDKKNDVQGVKTCLLNRIGACSWNHFLSEEEIKEAFRFLHETYYHN